MKYIFLVSAITFFLMLLLGKLFVFRNNTPNFVANYSVVLALIIVIYSISVFAFVFARGFFNVFVITFIAFSPFIIGKITSYKTLGVSTVVQLLTILGSILYVVQFI